MDIDRIREIKSRVNLQTVVEDAGIHFTKGKACCPFHKEKTASFSVKGNRYKCFACNESGDVIEFVCKYYNLSPLDAAKKLDADYSLNIFRELTKEDKKEIARVKAARNKEREEQELFEAVRDSIFEKKIKRYHMLKRIMETFSPERFGLNDIYTRAYNEHQKIEHWLTEEKLYDDIRGSSGV